MRDKVCHLVIPNQTPQHDTDARQMASSASRFFATTELLEQVLLDDSISVQHVFTLKRTNRRFCEIIVGSFYLQGKMYLRHLTNTECAKYGSSSDVLSYAKLQPFTLTWYPTRAEVVEFSLTLEFNNPDEGPCCLRNRGARRLQPVPLCWQGAKLSPNVRPAEITVSVIRKVKGTPQWAAKSRYDDTIRLDAHEATLGNLFIVLREVKERSWSEHDKLAQVGYLSPRPFGGFGHMVGSADDQERGKG